MVLESRARRRDRGKALAGKSTLNRLELTPAVVKDEERYKKISLEALRRLGLKQTDLAQAQCSTIRLKLLKIGALVRITVRRVWVSMAEGYPYTGLFAQAWAQLRASPC